MTQWNKVVKNDSEGYNDVNWKCEELPEIEGTLENIKKDVGVHKQTVFTVKSPDGTEYNVWETTVLKRLLADIELGSYIKIVYVGKKKSSNGLSAYKDYDLFVASETEQAATPAPTLSEAEEVVVTADNGEDNDEVPF